MSESERYSSEVESPVFANMQARYSCRDFQDRLVDDDLIDEILRAGQVAPSACNLQPYFFYVVTGESMARLNALRPWYGAPVVILGCYCSGQGWVRGSDHVSFRQFDLGLSMGQMALRAQDLGLGSCFIASFPPFELQEALKLPPEHCPEIALAVGYPQAVFQQSVQHKKRKSKTELVGYRR